MQNNLQIYIYIYLVYSLYSMLHILICGICTISHTCFPQPFTLADKKAYVSVKHLWPQFVLARESRQRILHSPLCVAYLAAACFS